MVINNIAFRTDASSQIGTGHFMRCLTLANKLKQHGAKIRFMSRNLSQHLIDMLTDKGHEFVALVNNHNNFSLGELAHSSWLSVSQEQDALDSIQALSDRKWDWLIVDHYALDSYWETMLRQAVKKILVIDDIADRDHECDILLDQNFYSDMETRYNDKVSENCKLILGPTYALLRDEYYKLHEEVNTRNGTVKHILVFFGGIDVDNYTGRVIRVLSEIDVKGIHIDVVIGVQHPFAEQINMECIKYGFICHIQTKKMAELITTADLAIGAGGSASWERCCLGLPSILVALADNQINIANGLDLLGACIYIGKIDEISDHTLKDVIEKLLRSPQQLKGFSEKAYSLVDGLGVDRVCQEMNC